MTGRLLKERFKRLQYGPLRWIVAIAASIQQSVKEFAPVYIYIDRDGDWYNRRHDVTFVSRTLNVSSFAAVRASVNELWCHGKCLATGNVVVDMGAGIGDDVVAFSRLVGEGGRVIAIEAHPDTFRCLEKTIKANGLNNVSAINIAAMERESDVYISDRADYLVNSIVGNSGERQIRGRAFDQLLDELKLRAIDLVKMNIEGSETVALCGMSRTLRSSSDVVISCHDFVADNHDGDPRMRTSGDVTRILEAAGFEVSRRSDSLMEEVRDYIYGKKLVK